jgi:hypothetical protein
MSTKSFPQTREVWLAQVAEKVVRPWFDELGLRLPPRIRFGVGWPHGGSNTNTVAECYVPHVSGDGATEIIIGTNYSDPVRIVDAVVHELLHASLGHKAGHGPEFARFAQALGLIGKPTSTVAGPELTDIIHTVVERFGAYPHASINLGGAYKGGAPGEPGGPRSFHEKPKQSTRMVKCVCLNIDCESFEAGAIEGYIARTTRKWLDAFGAPRCPACDEQLTAQGV